MRPDSRVCLRHVFLFIVILLCAEVFYILYSPSLLSNNKTTIHNISKEEEEETLYSANQEQDTVVLVWMWPFGDEMKLRSCSELFHITGCRLTDDRREYDKAHGVMFHHRDIYGYLSELLRMRRPLLQKWVWMNMESPANSQRLAQLDGLFNLTASYRRDSDIWVPYGRIVAASKEHETFKIPLKDKLVCWIVTNWNWNFQRVRYFTELQKHIWIHTYGGAFKKHLSVKEYYKTISSCKFYLSFENSIHKDYFTEKLFNPLMSGTVPVVLGSPRENYEEVVPSDSFIHVDDFKSPHELAEHLKHLDQDQEAYERYFTWRQHFTAERSYFALEHACRSCEHIKNNKAYLVFKNLSKWYWG